MIDVVPPALLSLGEGRGALLGRTGPNRRHDFSPWELARRANVFRAAVQRDQGRRFRAARFKTLWNVDPGVAADEVEMVMLVDVIEEGEGRRIDKYPHGSQQAEQADQQQLPSARHGR